MVCSVLIHDSNFLSTAGSRLIGAIRELVSKQAKPRPQELTVLICMRSLHATISSRVLANSSSGCTERMHSSTFPFRDLAVSLMIQRSQPDETRLKRIGC
jgi:hypothetical protein